MPLFSLVATYTTDGGDVLLLSSHTETKDLEGGKLMKEWVVEFAKQKTPDLNQSKGSFKKDNFQIFYINHSDLPITSLAYTNKTYNSDLAFKCLVEYETMVETEFPERELKTLKKDPNRPMKSAQRLVETYYTGASLLLNENTKKKVTDAVQRAEVNLDKTKKLKDDTDKLTYYANKMKEDGEIMTGKREPPNKSSCAVF